MEEIAEDKTRTWARFYLKVHVSNETVEKASPFYSIVSDFLSIQFVCNCSTIDERIFHVSGCFFFNNLGFCAIK
jgi:hypothetical protein